jgi:lipid-binding SYLF domain-containing protein
MNRLWIPLMASLVLTLAAAPLRADPREVRTLDLAAATIRAFGDLPLQGIPQSLLENAQGVAIIPHVLKAGFLVDGRFGRGVILARQPDGTWSNPVFVTLAGGGVGWQVGIASTDVVLVFRTAHSLDRILRGRGKVTLGGDVAVAAGPLGREAQAATDARLQAEIYSYSRSRGLFVGVSLEGAGLLFDGSANAAFYGSYACSPEEVAAAANLRAQLARLSPPPAVLVVPGPPPPP